MIATIDLENTYTSGVYRKRPFVLIRGCGASVWDSEGRAYIDCTAGYGVANIGHGRLEIAAALSAQAERLIACPELVYNDVRARLLERLASLTPAGLTHIFLCNSGTEAVEGALKFARLASGRSEIVAMLRSFHGRTMGALATTWEPHYREPFAPLVPGISHIRYNDLAAAEVAITEKTAAVIIELVQGEGGVHIASEEYIRGLTTLCRERGALLIVDEVQTGFGRTGRLFASDHYQLQADILCLAKSIAAGVPMGAICLGPRVMESGRITAGVHGSSFGGNPLACAAALATLDILEREGLPERAAALGTYALEQLSGLRSPLIREIRGRGLLLGIELRSRAQPYLEALLERGVFALQAGPNVIRLLPPLVITEEELERVLDAVAEILGAVRLQGGTAGTGPVQKSATSISWAQAAATSSGHSNEVDLLHNMLSIASYSREEAGLAHYLLEQARQMQLSAHIDDAGNFIASTPSRAFNAGLPPLILLSHMDTVRGYIPVRLQEGVLYGRGAVDAKGALAAFLCATARLRGALSPESLRHPLVVIGAVEEEAATSRGARAVVERYQPLACIIGEPSGSQGVTIGYKGRLLVEYSVTRPQSHSAGPQQTASEVAVAFWQRAHQHAATWNEEHAADSVFAALQPSLRSMSSEQDGFEERSRLLIGYRLPPAYACEELRAQLERWATEDGAHLSFTGEEVAFQTTRTTPLARAFTAAIRATGGRPVFKHKTGTSDMNVVGPVWGQNIVAYGPGDSRLDHTPQEHISLAEYLHAIAILELVLRELTLGRESLC